MHFYFSVIFVFWSIVTVCGSPPSKQEASNAAAKQPINEKYLLRKKRAFLNLPINVNEWLYNNDAFYDDLIYSASHAHN